MSKKHHNDGPTFRPGTMKATRGPAPSLEKQKTAQAKLEQDCERTRQLNKLPYAERIAFMVKLASKE